MYAALANLTILAAECEGDPAFCAAKTGFEESAVYGWMQGLGYSVMIIALFIGLGLVIAKAMSGRAMQAVRTFGVLVVVTGVLGSIGTLGSMGEFGGNIVEGGLSSLKSVVTSEPAAEADE